MDSLAFVQKTFREYYANDFSLDESVRMIEKREFGFASFEGWMLRHRSFRDEGELKSFLADSAPRDAYSSCAYYADPEVEMERKGWLGADLIFDIDADHIPTSCDKIHDEWKCGKCGFPGKGIVPEKCPVCGSEKFDDSTWPCEICLSSAKSETIRLLDTLMNDFGFSEKEIRVFFSGHRGYHVQVEDEAVKSLDAIARKEIVDYVCGAGLDLSLYERDKKNMKILDLRDSGWRGRIARGAYNFVHHANHADYMSIGVSANVAGAITKRRDVILKNWAESKPWQVKGLGSVTWKKIIEHAAKSQLASVDTVVTTDIHRLIRLSNSLHGKTGLRKIEFPVSAVDRFDPFTSAIAFKGGVATVFVSSAPKFRLSDEEFGPYKNQKVELPIAAAVFLVCKRRAEVKAQDVQ